MLAYTVITTSGRHTIEASEILMYYYALHNLPLWGDIQMEKVVGIIPSGDTRGRFVIDDAKTAYKILKESNKLDKIFDGITVQEVLKSKKYMV